eukprot:g15254.t1
MMRGAIISKAIKDLLRSMLHAWYDLTKEETGAWTAQLEAEAALQQEMRDPRKDRPAARSAWVQRMMAPKNKTARGAEDEDKGGGSGGREDAPGSLESTLEKEAVVGTTPSRRRDAQGCHPLRSRYLRVRTVPPDSIRYGRSPSSPAPPQPMPPSVSHRPAAACRRSPGARLQKRRVRRREERPPAGETERRGRNNHLPRRGLTTGTSSCGSSNSGDGFGKRATGLRGEEDEWQRCAESRDAWEDADGSRFCHGPPPLEWEELEPWEQRNPGTPWMASSPRGRRSSPRRCELGSGAATGKYPFVAPNDKVLRQVCSRLERFASIDRRHQKITALLLLQDGALGESGSTSSGCVYHHRSHNQRFRSPTGGGPAGTGGAGSRLRVGTQGGGKNNNGRRRCVAGFRLGHVARNNKRRGWNNDSSSVLMPGGGAPMATMLSRMAVDGVGRDILNVRKGRRNMSDGPRRRETRQQPSSSLPEGPFDATETRGRTDPLTKYQHRLLCCDVSPRNPAFECFMAFLAVVIEAVIALKEMNVITCSLPWLVKHLLRDPKRSRSKAFVPAAYQHLVKALKDGLANGSLVKRLGAAGIGVEEKEVDRIPSVAFSGSC